MGSQTKSLKTSQTGGGGCNTLNPPPGSASELGHRLLTAFLALLTTGRTRKKKHGLPNTRTHGLDLISRRSRAKMAMKCQEPITRSV